MGRVRIGVLGGAALAYAIALFACTDTSGLTGDDADAGPDAVAETSAGDSAPPPPPPSGIDSGTDADAAEAPNLLTNGDFELGCGGWDTAFQAVATEDPIAHAGAKSCKVCNTADVAGDVSQHVFGVVAGGQYLAEAWVHAPTLDASAPSAKVQVGITILDSANAFLKAAARSSINTSTAMWIHQTAVVDVPDGGAGAIVLVQLDNAPTSACFLVDDVRFTRVK